MILKRLQVKTGQDSFTNSYVIYDKYTKETMVIDPGGEPEKIIELLDILEVESLKYILLTHCHADHIGGISGLKNAKGGTILISRDDSVGLYDKSISLAEYINMEIPELEAVFTGDTLFSGTWGRTDLPTGSFVGIMTSITDKLMTLPDETIVYPGHGKITMIQDEKNIYLELKEKDF